MLTGAGLSVESGLASFQADTGLWAQHDVNRVCNYLTWKVHRDEVFAFYAARKREILSALPNLAHLALACWQARWGDDRVVLLTQNIDDLLERAGATAVTHLHGHTQAMHCTACAHRWSVGDALYDVSERCPKCNSLRGVKPSVVFYHERAPEYGQLRKMAKAITQEDVVLVIGSALQVLTMDQVLPRWRWGHARNVQINPNPVTPEFFGVNLALSASAGCVAVLPQLEAWLGPAA